MFSSLFGIRGGSSSLSGAVQHSSFQFVCNRMFSHSSSNSFLSLLSRKHHLVFPEPSCLLVLHFTDILSPTDVNFFKVTLTAPVVVHGSDYEVTATYVDLVT